MLIRKKSKSQERQIKEVDLDKVLIICNILIISMKYVAMMDKMDINYYLKKFMMAF